MERAETIRGRGGRQAAMLLRHGRRVAIFAYLLIGDSPAARKTTTEAFARMFGEYQELISPFDFDVRSLRRIVELARTNRRFSEAKRVLLRRPKATDPLQRLGVRKRAALVLRFHEDMRDSEIAAVLQCSEGAVRSFISSGLHAVDLRAEDLRDRFAAMAAGAPAEDPGKALSRGRILRFEIAALAVVAPIALVMSLQLAITLTPGPVARPAEDFVPRERALNETLYDRFPPVGGKTDLITGRFSGERWVVDAYRSPGRTLCIEVFNAGVYGAGHCVSSYTDYMRTFVSPDLNRRTTFIYGVADGEARSVALRRRGGSPIDTTVVASPRTSNLGSHSFFGAAIPGYLLQLDNRLEGVRLGYVVARVYVTARDAHGRVVERSKILLAEP